MNIIFKYIGCAAYSSTNSLIITFLKDSYKVRKLLVKKPSNLPSQKILKTIIDPQTSLYTKR